MKVWTSHKDSWTGVAWLSSVRGLNCSLKWGNERNPRRVLQVSRETAPLCGEEARMTPNQHDPLIPWATHMIQSPIQRVAIPRGKANLYKVGASSDWGLQLDLMKPELLVIAGQTYCGEYVLKSCTHCPSRQGSREDLKHLFNEVPR